jgi:hypothetical protein
MAAALAALRLAPSLSSFLALAAGLVICCIAAGTAAVGASASVQASVSGYGVILTKLQQQHRRSGQVGIGGGGVGESVASTPVFTGEQRRLLWGLAWLALPGNDNHTELATEVAEALESKRLVLPFKTLLEFPCVAAICARSALQRWRDRRRRTLPTCCGA